MSTDVVLETAIGRLRLRMSTENRIRITGVDGPFANVQIDGRKFSLSAVLEPLDTVWTTARTPSGNEASHGFKVWDYGVSPIREATKKQKDELRPTVVAAVNRFIKESPNLLRDMKLHRLRGQIEAGQRQIEGYEAAISELKNRIQQWEVEEKAT
jgi:hypothetical protein